MTLTQDQQKLVEENMGLVGKVIKDKVHGLDQLRFFTYDDLYQIGCIGLCKAVSSDKGGCFSTFAYRLIWNEICSALIYANRRAGRECELVPEILDVRQQEKEYSDLHSVLGKIEAEATDAMAKGIRALRLNAEGYSCAEIGQVLGESAKCVAARISRTRKYLKDQPALAAFHSLQGVLNSVSRCMKKYRSAIRQSGTFSYSGVNCHVIHKCVEANIILFLRNHSTSEKGIQDAFLLQEKMLLLLLFRKAHPFICYCKVEIHYNSLP